ncbi:MAG: efflux RND transporter periplasmic adaptor subunit, partial [Prosthecobacter sp.]|nr:efflux RND transporter periplasmic adaptor subunit [Prosthecobacter sp.]
MHLFLKIIRIILPLSILAGCGWWVVWLISHPPAQEQVTAPVSLVRVEGTVLQKTRYEVKVRTQGTVQPRTRSTLLPEVGGRVVEVSPSFRPGGFFEKNEVLLRLDPTDYEAAVIIAKSEVAQAEVVVAEEKARAEQAAENWRALGRSGSPAPLVARAPQLALAEANLAAARARLSRAERDVERTIIRAPYQGQVMEQGVDVGQFVSQGTVLGRIFAVDYAEVRLPLPERESRFLRLPLPFREGSSQPAAGVVLTATIAGRQASWKGSIVRVEGSLDEQTRQAIAVAQVMDPYGSGAEAGAPLKMGTFVQAEITGDTLEDVYVIPRQAVRAGYEIILIERPQNTLRRLTVEPLATHDEHIVVSATTGKVPPPGAVLCLT